MQEMERLGTDFDITGSVMSRDKLEDQRRKRGECVTCGRKCFHKKLFKTIPITEHGLVLNGRCLNCHPLDTGVIPAVSRPATSEDLERFSRMQSILKTSGKSGSQRGRQSFAAAGSPNSNAGTPTTPDGRSQSSRSAMRSRPNSSTRSAISQPSFSSGSSVGSSGGGGGIPTTGSLGPHTTGTSLQSLNSASSGGGGGGVHSSSNSYRSNHENGNGIAPPRAATRSASDPARRSRTPRRDSTGRTAPPESAAYASLEAHLAAVGHQSCTVLQYQDDGSGVFAPSKPMRRVNSSDGLEAAMRRLQGHAAATAAAAAATASASGDEEEDGYDIGSMDGSSAADAIDYYRRTYQERQHSAHSLNDSVQDNNSVRSGPSPNRMNPSTPSGSRRGTDSVHSIGSMSSYEDHDGRFGNPGFVHSHPLLEAHLESNGGHVGRRSAAGGGGGIQSMALSDHSRNGVRSLEGQSLHRANPSIDEDGTDFADDDEDEEDSTVHVGLDRLQAAGQDYVEIINVMRDFPNSPHVQSSALQELSELHLTPDDSMTLLHIGALQVIVDAMYSFPADLQLQIYGCRSMWNASGIAENQLNFVQGGALDIILQDMESFVDDVDLQEQALATIANLGALEANLDLMIEKESITHIIQAMNKHSDTIDVQVKGCLAIANLASHMTPLKKAIQEMGGGDAVVISMVMHPNDAEIQEKGLRALRNLSANCDENKIVLTNIGGVDAVISAMQVHRDSAGVQEAGAWTLSNLAGNPDCKAMIGDIGGIDVLIRAMWVHSENVSVTEWCCRALFTLSMDPRNSKLILDVGGISATVNAMQAHVDSAVVQEMGCGILGNLPADQATKMRIVEEEALDAIVLAMVLYSDAVEVQERACHVLLELAIKENLKAMHASNVGAVVRAASVKFPESCQPVAQRLIRLMENYVEEYG